MTKEFFLRWNNTCLCLFFHLWNSYLKKHLHCHICIYLDHVSVPFQIRPQRKLNHSDTIFLIPKNSSFSIDQHICIFCWTNMYHFHTFTLLRNLLHIYLHYYMKLCHDHAAENSSSYPYIVWYHHTNEAHKYKLLLHEVVPEKTLLRILNHQQTSRDHDPAVHHFPIPLNIYHRLHIDRYRSHA